MRAFSDEEEDIFAAWEDEEWRGDEHLEDWPEELAGPEYWMYKAMAEDPWEVC